MEIRMRPARRADYKTIWRATLQTVWDDTPSDERIRLDRDRWEAHFRKKIEPYVEGSRTEAWVAEDANTSFLGYLLVGPGGGFLTPEQYGFIYDVWVAPEHRGKGVGTFLVKWATEWARRQGYKKIKLEVAETNERARSIYESLGFHPERRYMGKDLGDEGHENRSPEQSPKR